MIKITSILFARLMPAIVQATGRGGASPSTAEDHPQAKGISSLYYGCIVDENTLVSYTQATGKSECSLDRGISVYASIANGDPTYFLKRQ